ncbi:MAG TPA: hypothetical protein VNH46_07875, partial [Gemmatimonadales bacterium]|nr:hypothetical protein [Gemmatimonadales bacterium]
DTATALTVRHPGQAAAFVLSNLTFGVVPTTGFYLRADDSNPSDGLTLTLNVVGASPVSGAPYIQEVNGAVVKWPPAPTWTGATSTDWFTTGNWSTNSVPTASDSVVIAAATFQPVLTGPASVGAVNLSGGSLSLNGQTLTVAGNFITSGTGVLISATAGSQLVVGGDAGFGGGDETGQLSAGTLSVAGNFSQAAGTGGNNTFVATGTHRTIFNGTGPQTLTLATSSATESRFFDLAIQNTGGAVSIPSGIVAVSDSVLIPGAGTLNGAGSLSAGWVKTAVGSTLGIFQLTTSGTNLSVAGTYGVNQTILVGGPTVPALSYQNLVLTGLPAHSLTANVATTGFLTIQGQLTLAGHTANVGGNFQTATGGLLTMTNAADQLTALGNVTFDGGSETGQLTAGLLEVGGDFSQLATTSTTSFVASGTHLTRLINANKQVSMASGTATFNDLEVNTAGTATVNGQIQVARDLTVTAGGTLTGNTVVVGRNVSVVAGSFLTVSFLQFSGTLSNAGLFSPGSVWFANPAGGTIPASGSGITYGSVIVGPSGGGSAFSTGGPVS